MAKHRGFTLLEMIIAIGIFAVIAAIGYGGLNRFIDGREVIVAKQDEIKTLQIAFTLFEQDMRYMTNRSVRDGFGDLEASILAAGNIAIPPNELLRFTTAQPSPTLDPAQRLRRVAWRLDDGVLSRITWLVLDRDQDSVELERKVLNGVADVKVEYFSYDADDKLENKIEWEELGRLPAGIELSLTLDAGKQYRRLFSIAGGS